MDSQIRRQDRKISEDDSLELLMKGEYGVLSMCSAENQGYGIPLNYVFEEDKLYFHCAVEGSKLGYLKNNCKVSFCVVGPTKLLPSKFGVLYSSVIVFGEVTEVAEDEKREALMLIVKKYSSDFMEEGKEYIDKLFDRVKVLKLSIKTITGKSRRY